MTPPLITCTCCNGTGKRELPLGQITILERVRKSTTPISTTSLQEKGVSSMAINNRLVLLESHKLIRRVGKDGKFILWEAVKKPTNLNE